MTQEELVVKLKLDSSGLKGGISSATSSLDGLGASAEATARKSSSVFKDILKANYVTKAVDATVKGIKNIAKGALDSYADYEQLVGGVETLFKDSADVVQKNAANAFKTAGLSANEYMENVTSFSASLLQSVGGDTQKAAEVADMAMIDMADNANKMGTSMQSIQNAYQGFAKQNYTMLDNLKLGYGGTKQEMERLLADAQAITGVEYDISNLKDVYEAIHVIQGELGITGTTALEASTTIQGSVSAMKSAWANLLTGIADDNADMEQLIGNFVDSLSTAAGNIIPRIEVIFSGIGQLVEQLVPELLKMVPGLIENVLPGLLEAATSAVMAIVDCIVENLPMFVEVGMNALISLADGIAEALPDLIPQIVEVVLTIVETFLDNVDKLVEVAGKLIIGLAEGLIKAIPTVVSKVPEIVKKIVQAFANLVKEFVNVGKQLLQGLATGIGQAVGQVVQKAKEAAQKVVNGVKSFLGIKSPSKVFAEIGDYMMQGLGDGIYDNSSIAVNAIKDVAGDVEDAFNPDLDTKFNIKPIPGQGNGFIRDVKWIQELVDKLNSKGENTPIIFQIDGKTFAQTSVNKINELTRTTGKLGLVVR